MAFLLPIVKKSVSVIARVLAAVALGAGVFSLAEVLGAAICLPLESREGVGVAFFCGFLAQICRGVQLTLAALLAPWCVHVLLGRGGNEPLRLLSWICGFTGLAVLANQTVALAGVGRFFLNPGLAGLALSSMLGILIVSATPYFHAAPPRLKRALWAMALLYPATAVLDTPATFWWQDAATAVLGILQFTAARKLARVAPAVVSLPPADEEADRP